ncbi:NAD(P)-binding protein [Mytilinidion resinicola]|uniref:NAD(P)-binding protein n=1 Tax=Mytilinidion resinicola TaxID=574789 RepID=A0A6A6YSV4_9PEZI|nr:NAD(P)-binding protein [Mytilinidion resinicola]KAF2811648.1 NAD(P)-binding protein [Mytilinidion resinicola]
MAYILLTGASGNLGAVILEQLLSEGHNVNAIIRSFAKNKGAITKIHQKAVDSGRLSFTEIPDMAAPKAFHESAKNASAIIHAATPLSYDNFLEEIIKPVSIITNNVLDASAASPTVKRLIITGSIVSTLKLPDELYSGKTLSEKDWNPLTAEQGVENVFNAYAYSKTISEQEAWAYMEEKKPSFELIYLLAPSITGKSTQPGAKLSRQQLGGIGGFYRSLFDVETLGWQFPYYMDVEDVAAIHLKSLSPSVPGNLRYLFHSEGIMNENTVADFVREKYPELKSRVPAGAEKLVIPEGLVKTDISRANAAFGTGWKSWQDSVVEMVNDVIRFEREGLVDGGVPSVVLPRLDE